MKDYWWYLDALPSHAWNRWRYHYPQAAFPMRTCGRKRPAGQVRPEYELLDTGVFNDDRYWITEVWYAKADPTDVLMTVRVTNAGPDADTVHVLPTAWFRNTWSWDTGAPKPMLAGAGGSVITAEHPFLGSLELLAGAGPDGTSPVPLFCENETNLARLYGAAPTTPYPKDGIGEHVISGAATVNPDQRGTKCAFWYRLSIAPGETAELRLGCARRAPRAARELVRSGPEQRSAVQADIDRGEARGRQGAHPARPGRAEIHARQLISAVGRPGGRGRGPAVPHTGRRSCCARLGGGARRSQRAVAQGVPTKAIRPDPAGQRRSGSCF